MTGSDTDETDEVGAALGDAAADAVSVDFVEAVAVDEEGTAVVVVVETLSARLTTRSMDSSRVASDAAADVVGAPPLLLPIPDTPTAFTALTDAGAARGDERRDNSGGR